MNARLLASAVSLTICALAAVPAVSTHAASACDRQPILQIDSAKLSVEPDGFSVDAYGTSESAGWFQATLVVAQTSGATATVDFVGCRPEVAAQVLTPIQASARLELPPDMKHIIIRARTNSMTVDVNVP